MECIRYHKLVRDRIPEIITSDGGKCTTQTLTEADYLAMLDLKLTEELNEYQESKSMEELADLLEVMHAVVEARGHTMEEVEAIRLRKRGYTRCVESLWQVLRHEGLAAKEKPRKKHKPKPYEQMQYPGQRIQIDVKVVPRSCRAEPELKLYQYTAIDEYSRYRILG